MLSYTILYVKILQQVPEKSTIIPKLIENENVKLREALAKKEELLTHKENEIQKVHSRIEEVSKKLVEKQSNEQHFHSIITDYENVLTKIITEHQQVVHEKQTLEKYVKNLEAAFSDLFSKYEQAKFVIEGLKDNENILKTHLRQYEDLVEQYGKRYNNLQEHAIDKLNKASERLDKTDKKHIAETAKLRAEILQSKVRINDLEKQISLCNIKGGTGDSASQFSMFTPLKSHFIR